ncbi:MAG: family 16 glycosylhydrolase [Hyphomonadaceae bacterium]|nr:family 16 glycosylhydrolase [Hyphomonadaceae bacterium]
MRRLLAALAILAAAAMLAGALYWFFTRGTKAYDEKALFAPLPESVVFIDRFRTLDETRWSVSDGWSNGDFMDNDWRREAISLTPTGLAITMRRNLPELGRDKPYMSGELQSREAFQYGYYEASMRLPPGDGVLSAFFTFTRPEGASTWEEIDIEFVGTRPRYMEAVYHLHGRSVGKRIHLGFDPSQAFHTYGFEWTPDALRWYVDNRLVHEVRDPRLARMTRPQQLIVFLASASGLAAWLGELDRSKEPWVLHVSCVAHARQYDGVSLCARPHGAG